MDFEVDKSVLCVLPGNIPVGRREEFGLEACARRESRETWS